MMLYQTKFNLTSNNLKRILVKNILLIYKWYIIKH